MKFKFNKDIYDYEPSGCCPGSEKSLNVSESIDESGNLCLVGEEFDQQEVIDSYYEGTTIERIILAHGLGDEIVLNEKPGVFLDEDQVSIMKNAQSNTLELNAQLLSLYKDYKDFMSFDDFSNAVATGDFKFLEDSKKPKEEVNQ